MNFSSLIVLLVALFIFCLSTSSGQRVRPIPIRVIASRLPVTGSRLPILQVSISSTFNVQLLHVQIPKTQKDYKVKQFFMLLGSSCVKDANRTLMKLTPGSSFIFLNRFISKRNEITKRIANGEIKLSHFAMDNDKFYHYYEIIKTKK